MTIKDLNNFINKKYSHLKIEIPIKNFSGKRIAIDFFDWMYANYQVIHSHHIDSIDILNEDIDMFTLQKDYLNNLIRFIKYWTSYNITPIIVMDGETPELKKETKKKRGEKRDKIKNEIDKIYTEIDNIINNDILENIDELVIKLKSKTKNLVIIPNEIIELSKLLITSLGIPCIQAIGDAEKVCANLCREGIVAGVYSDDIDTLAFGSPLMIKEFSKDRKNLVCIRLDHLLTEFKMDYTQFVDFCILCSCDYNVNIPNLGVVNSYKQIIQYKRIENIEAKYDYECLKHEACRNEFKIINSKNLILKRYLPENIEADFYDIIEIYNLEFFDNYELDDNLIYLIKSINNLLKFNKPGHSIKFDLDIIQEKKLCNLQPRKIINKRIKK